MLARLPARHRARAGPTPTGNRDEAVDLLVKEYPNLKREDERVAARRDARATASATHAQAKGWGAMDPAVWQEQIALYAELGQFTARTPKLDEVMTLDILKATADARPKIG